MQVEREDWRRGVCQVLKLEGVTASTPGIVVSELIMAPYLIGWLVIVGVNFIGGAWVIIVDKQDTFG